MHSKQKGSLGELAVAKELTRKGYYVFKELGDNCKCDLILVNTDYVLTKVQVKCRTSDNGTVCVKSSKSGPNYRFDYEEKHADIYAVYIEDKDQIFYINSKELLKQRQITFRIEPTKNNQSNGVRYIGDYLNLERVLRGHTLDTLTDNAEGDDMVQTTTPTGGLGNQE